MPVVISENHASYATVTDLRNAGVDNSQSDDLLQAALDLASVLVDEYTGTVFTTATASTKVFYDQRTRIIPLSQPASSITAVGVSGYDLTSSQWQLDGQVLRLFPVFMRDGSGFPLLYGGDFASWAYDQGRSTYGYDVSVTATWGWASVPLAVKQATILLAKDQLASPLVAGASDARVRAMSVEGFSVTLDSAEAQTMSTGNIAADRLLRRYRTDLAGVV
jgi:hypothetical protein